MHYFPSIRRSLRKKFCSTCTLNCMRVGNDSAFVEFEPSYIELNDPLARCYEVRTEKNGFAGIVGEVWIAPGDAERFLAQLNELEQNTAETAELRNLSSGSDASPLSLDIRKIDSLGHIGVFATLRKTSWIREKTSNQVLSISFELDRELLSKVISDFKSLFSK